MTESPPCFAEFVRLGVGLVKGGFQSDRAWTKDEFYTKAKRYGKKTRPDSHNWKLWLETDGGKHLQPDTKTRFRFVFLGTNLHPCPSKLMPCGKCEPCKHHELLTTWLGKTRSSAASPRTEAVADDIVSPSTNVPALEPDPGQKEVGYFAELRPQPSSNGEVRAVFSYGTQTIALPATTGPNGEELDELWVDLHPREMFAYVDVRGAELKIETVGSTDNFQYEKHRWKIPTPKRPNVPLPIHQKFGNLVFTNEAPVVDIVITCQGDDFDPDIRHPPPGASATDLLVLKRSIQVAKGWKLRARGTELVLVRGRLRTPKAKQV